MNRAIALALAIGVAGITPALAQRGSVDSCVGITDRAALQACEDGRGQNLNSRVDGRYSQDPRYNQSAQYDRVDRSGDISNSRNFGIGDGAAGIGTSPSARSPRSFNDGGSGQ
jgi:hypothetical protein